MRRLRRALLAVLALTACVAAAAEPIRIVHINSTSGVLAPAGRDLARGLRLGFEYASGGSMAIDGRAIELIEHDDELDPRRARALVERAYTEEQAHLVVGPVASGVALTVLPLAASHRRPIMPQGRLDALTGNAGHPFVVRVGRTVAQEASANAVVLGEAGVCVAALAQDYQIGREAMAAFRQTLRARNGRLVREEYLPATAEDATPVLEQLVAALRAEPECPSARYLFLLWADENPPLEAARALNPERYGIRLAAKGQDLSLHTPAAATEGATYYHFLMPDNPVNDWLVVQHLRRHHAPPSFFTVQGFTEAVAIVAAIRRAGSTEGEELMRAFRGLRVQGPSGEIYIRPQDQQALQGFFHYRLAAPEEGRRSEPVLVRRLRPQEIPVPLHGR